MSLQADIVLVYILIKMIRNTELSKIQLNDHANKSNKAIWIAKSVEVLEECQVISQNFIIIS